MATVNIPSYHDDPNYRYKMPRVRAKVEGRGNGVKTNIMNMGEIARALKRDPQYPTKFCGCELGASSKFEAAEGKAIVNGIHSDGDVQLVIDKFIERFVLCPKCRLPEIDLMVVGSRVQGKCNACGHQGDMDNAHKVATYIVKNPPDGVTSTMGKKVKGKKKDDEEKRPKAVTSAVLATPEEKKKDKKKKKDDKKADDQEGDDKDGDDKAEKKKKKRHHHRHHHQQHALNYSSPEVEQVIERLEMFLNRTGEKPSIKDFYQEVRLLQVAQDFSGAIRVYVAFASLMHGKQMTVAIPEAVLPYLASVCDRSIEGDMVLEALEQLVYRRFPNALASYGRILHQLYEEDVIEEECILERYGAKLVPKSEEGAGEQTTDEDDGRKKALADAHAAAATFVQWLKQAESASDSDAEDLLQGDNAKTRTTSSSSSTDQEQPSEDAVDAL